MKFENTFVQIENERNIINKHASPWGNSGVTITEEDIAALRAGKLLFYFDGEYGTFVKLQDDK